MFYPTTAINKSNILYCIVLTIHILRLATNTRILTCTVASQIILTVKYVPVKEAAQLFMS